MKTIFLIATDCIRGLLHQRLLLGLMLACLGLTVFFSITLSSNRKNTEKIFANPPPSSPGITGTSTMSEVDRRKYIAMMDELSSTIQAGFYGSVSFGGSMVALFIFGTAVAAEIRKGTIRLTLSKPVSRTQFLLGKYLGGVAVMAGYAIIASLAMLLFAHTQGVDLNPALKWAPWLMFCRQLMLGSLAMLLSLWMHPMIAGVLAFFAGNGFYGPHNPLYYILPSYKEFNVLFQVLEGTLIERRDVFFLSLYALDFVVIVLLLALWRFRTKELV
jgi:ABC-type transport system involved in multi-copper enzyme maturation permease subunit